MLENAAWWHGWFKWICVSINAMSEDQLSALRAKLKDDAGPKVRLKGAANLDAAVVIAQDA